VISGDERPKSKLQPLVERARRGTVEDIDFILSQLTSSTPLAMTKFIDFALGLVESEAGTERIEFHLHNGTQMQRNYCTLFFNRRGDWGSICTTSRYLVPTPVAPTVVFSSASTGESACCG
jgi:hypothetical protein